MIPAADTLSQIDSLPGKEIEFGIGDHRWVMRTQAKLYSDVSTAIIREYSTNAHDANVMAGNKNPIEVTLPTVLEPFFVVEDKGVGMNMTDLEETYTQFGISDKRDNADTNGLLGYGSKSGLAYTQSFHVTTIKDGTRIDGVVLRKPDWKIVLKVVAHKHTDEPNGTKIVIPVHNIDEFNHKAEQFFKFWLPGRVLVNGVEPKHDVGEKITDNLYYSNQWSTSYVVMGNVAYRIANPSALFWNTKMNHVNFVAYVDDMRHEDGGPAVDFTPAREDLEYSDRTKDSLHKVIRNFEAQIMHEAQNEINKATTHAEAYKAWAKWRSTLGASLFADLEFKGDKFQSQFDIGGYRYSPNGGRGNCYWVKDWNVESMPKTMVVTEFSQTSGVSSDNKRKARDYIDHMGWSASYIVFTQSRGKDIKSPWIDRSMFVKWDDLKAALPKKPRKVGVPSTTGGRISGSWDYWKSDGTMVEEKPLPVDVKNVYYITVQQAKRWSVRDMLNGLSATDKTDTVVLLVPANRLDKLLRENPKVSKFHDFAKSKVVIDSQTLLSDDAKAVMRVSYEARNWVNKLDETKVDDPAIAKIKAVIKDESNLLAKYRKNQTLARATGMWYNVKQYEPRETNYVKDTYPLLDLSSYYSKVIPDTYIYMNAKFASESENTK